MITLMLAIISMMIPIMICVLINRVIDVCQIGSKCFRKSIAQSLKGLLVLIIPVTVSVILYLYFSFNPITTFVRTLAIEWGLYGVCCISQ